MWNWLMDHLATILISLALLAVAVLIVRHFVRQKKQGKSSCGCGCSACALRGSCHGGASGSCEQK